VVASGKGETDDEALLGMMRDASCALPSAGEGARASVGVTRATAGRGRRIVAFDFSCCLTRRNVGPAAPLVCAAGGVTAGLAGSVGPAPAAIVVPWSSLLGGFAAM
jgi:hypothetical protein